MSKRLPRATKIILLRHAEKPAKDSIPYGVNRKGERNKESLTVRGWQRAGALANLFGTNGHLQHPSLATPKFLYASKPILRKGSRRSLQTIMPLADRLGIKVNSEFHRAEFESMLDEVFAHSGVVLICWQREYIPAIASLILGNQKIAPPDWPEDRYDMIWVFDLHRPTATYRFRQVPQMLLGGDETNPIK